MTAPSNTDGFGNTPSGKLPWRSSFAPPVEPVDPNWEPPDVSPLVDENGEVIKPTVLNDMAGIQAIKYRVGGPVSSGEVTS